MIDCVTRVIQTQLINTAADCVNVYKAVVPSRPPNPSKQKVHSHIGNHGRPLALCSPLTYGTPDMDIDRIRAFVLRLKPDLVCDDCVAERLNITATAVAPVTNELAGRTEFERAVGMCALCQNTRQTIHAR